MTDPLLLDHRRWLGYAQPVGLVVSPPALLAAQAYLNRNIAAEHRAFLAEVREIPLPSGLTAPVIADWPRLFVEQFGWQADDLQDAPPQLWIALPDYHDVLRPTHAVRALNPAPDASAWLALMQIEPVGRALDQPLESAGWSVSPQARFERLLRETRIPMGLLSNGAELRLIYAPRGESSGTLAFPVAAMLSSDGRILFAALHLLLSAERWFTLPAEQRLPAILAESRKYQNTVSVQLAAQVLAALYELLRGFQAADSAVNGALLGDLARRDSDRVYGGLLTVLLRLIFVLYAEDRGLISTDSVYVNHYAVSGLFERLRADAGRYPDTMDWRYGAWAQLLVLFRLIHGGAQHGAFRLTARRGRLFDPALYPFLEGTGTPGLPRVSDGVIYRVLSKLMMLNGERLSYRTLDVEHIGSVYEAMMGFTLLRAPGPMIAVKSPKAHGAAVMVDLAALLATAPNQRAKALEDIADQSLTGAALTALKTAATADDLLAALGNKVDTAATPDIAPAGSLVLQPTDERRKTGSHYTPPELTRPMVQEALRPLLAKFGESPTPEQILNLKVCDPAMGSGAFLVETGKQLAETLVAAWRAHRCVPNLPPDEDETLHARRLIALHCLYGVDKNPRAVELAQLSLWLATLARDHSFAFLDHALKCGDSLVGMNLSALRPASGGQQDWVRSYLEQRIAEAQAARARIQQAESEDEATLRGWLAEAEAATADLRWSGDELLAAALQPGSKAARTKAEKAARARIEQRLGQTPHPSLPPQGGKEPESPLLPMGKELSPLPPRGGGLGSLPLT